MFFKLIVFPTEMWWEMWGRFVLIRSEGILFIFPLSDRLIRFYVGIKIRKLLENCILLLN